ncbi:MAG: SUF system NifU family Fe-S cluster assembly protein [Chloroflexi bacterium]|nr:SUF system NifU family Fe-S cluster assembly protein [Chloroflexota bacterium]
MVDELDELYREVILDHYRSPRNVRPLADPDVVEEGNNPLCGDEVVVQLKLKDGRIDDVSVRGRGCSISRASGSIMSEAVKGKTPDDALALSQRFRELMRGSGDDASGLGDAGALQGVRKFPIRVKCALLAWTALEQGLEARVVKAQAGRG